MGCFVGILHMPGYPTVTNMLTTSDLVSAKSVRQREKKETKGVCQRSRSFRCPEPASKQAWQMLQLVTTRT
jgi:hypothetical protein